MRGRSKPCTASKFNLKTLKISRDTIDEVRTPIIWNRPSPGLYDYHYDVAGLYYQPMITYCMDRERGGERKRVDIPERQLSNLDKVAYRRNDDDPGLEDFLTNMYQRRVKEKHSKQIHCANELWSRSKKTTDLNTVRNAATTRDKYLCQIQLHYTGQIGKERVLGGRGSGDVNVQEEETITRNGVTVTRRSGRSVSAEPEEVYEEEIKGKKEDGRYGPYFSKIDKVDLRKVNHGLISGLALAGIPEPQLEAPDCAAKLEGRLVSSANDRYLTYWEDKKVADKFIAADTQKEFLELGGALRQSRLDANKKEYKALYNDTGYAKAKKDVERRVMAKGSSEFSLPRKSDINVNFRRRKLEDIGRYERSVILSEMYKDSSIPQFDIGYDTVERCMIPRA